MHYYQFSQKKFPFLRIHTTRSAGWNNEVNQIQFDGREVECFHDCSPIFMNTANASKSILTELIDCQMHENGPKTRDQIVRESSRIVLLKPWSESAALL